MITNNLFNLLTDLEVVEVKKTGDMASLKVYNFFAIEKLITPNFTPLRGCMGHTYNIY